MRVTRGGIAARRWIAVAFALLAASAWQSAAARADVTQSDGVVSVVLTGAVTDANDDIVSGARTPVLQIQVLTPSTTVQCHMNFDPDTNCGTQQTSGCPAYQCWTYSPTVADDTNFIYVDYTVQGQVPTYLDFDFITYAETPQTTLATPPDMNENYSGVQAAERPVFDIEAPADPLLLWFQCSLSPASGPVAPWGSCRVPRLSLTGIYRFSARAVDSLGRPDPAPPTYVFSPTPCRASVRGRIPSFAQLRRHGLQLTVQCIQPGRFETELDVPPAWEYGCHGEATNTLGQLGGRTTQTRQTLRLTLHTFRCVPSPASKTTRIPVQLWTIPYVYGASQSRKFKIHP